MSFWWNEVPEDELLYPGHVACQGCGAALAMRLALKAIGENVIVTIPACCWTIIAGPFPHNALRVPVFHTAFETTAAAASGIKAGLEMTGRKETLVMGWAGDGGTFDIGIQALSGAAERDDDILYVCYDNEAYMNTGIQRSSATPLGSWTTTTPEKHPESHPKKNIIDIMASHRIPYLASLSVAFPEDFIRKLRKAKEMKGTRFIHIFAPCPPGWRMPSDYTIRVARLAVETKVFPLLEVEGGERWTLNYIPQEKPVEEYLKLQGRFKHLSSEQVDKIREMVQHNWEVVVKRHESTHGDLSKVPRDGFFK